MAKGKKNHQSERVEGYQGFHFQLIVASLLFLFAVGLAERAVYFLDPIQGLAGHAAILVIVTWYVSARWDQSRHRYLLGFAIVPLLRIISLALPLDVFPLAAWYILVSLILSVAVLITAQRLELSRLDLGLRIDEVPVQLLIGLSGFLIGAGQYALFKPALAINDMTVLERIGLGLVLLLCSGLVEELIFRGLIQHVAEKILSRYLAWIFVAALYALLALGGYSILNVAFTFLISLFFSWASSRTNSIAGVSLAHGIANITLFLIMPGL